MERPTGSTGRSRELIGRGEIVISRGQHALSSSCTTGHWFSLPAMRVGALRSSRSARRDQLRRVARTCARTADRERQRRGSQSPSVTEAWPLLGSTDDRRLPMSRDAPASAWRLARIAGSSSRYARSATSPGGPHRPGMLRACRWIGHLRRGGYGWRPRARSGWAGTATRPRRWSIYGHGSSLAGSCGSPYGPGNGGRLALVSGLKPLAAIAERFPIAGTGSAGGVPARHHGRRKPGSETGRWRAGGGFPVRQG